MINPTRTPDTDPLWGHSRTLAQLSFLSYGGALCRTAFVKIAEAEVEFVRLLNRAAIPVRAGLTTEMNFDLTSLDRGWNVFKAFARIPAEDVRDSDALYFDARIAANPLSDAAQAELEAAPSAAAKLAVLDRAMEHRSFQLNFTRQFSPLDDDEYEQLQLIYLFDPTSPPAVKTPEFFWAGDDLEAFFRDVEASAPFQSVATGAAVPFAIFVGQGRT